jgi:hypothetical protein
MMADLEEFTGVEVQHGLCGACFPGVVIDGKLMLDGAKKVKIALKRMPP